MRPGRMPRGPSLPVIAAVVCAAVFAVHRLPDLPGPAWLVAAAIAVLLALSRADTRWLALVIAACIYTVVNAERRLAGRLPDEATGSEIGRAHAELQSRENLVCRLLLEKKKKKKK